MPIYLHELVHTVPGRTEAYLDSVAEHQGTAAARAARRDTLLGLWSATDATGVWPLAVNLWQVGTRRDLEENLARQFEPGTQDSELKKWWLGNLDLRTGGFDRLLESSPATRDVAGLRSAGVGGKLFLHQIVDVAPGMVDEYLAAFAEAGTPAIAADGGEVVGAYRTCLRSHEALTLIAFRDARDFSRFQAAWYRAGSDLHRWRGREDTWVRGKEALLLKPRYFLGSPWHQASGSGDA